MIWHNLHTKLTQNNSQRRSLSYFLHIDFPLLLALIALAGFGFMILYSASNQNLTVIRQQATHLGLAVILMLVFAQIPPETYRRWAPIIYTVGVLLLLFVLVTGHINKGAQRWLGFGPLRFQPSEILKLAIPMMLSYLLAKVKLPPNSKQILLCLLFLAIPVVLTAKQPDLGTAIILAATGVFVLFLAGLSWRVMILCFILGLILLPILWFFMHGYQQQRVLTFLNPERDPLGAGYHIIQSKIAIGSGGFFGKGWLQGSQSHLQFLPEHTTDFIFAVCGEELGLIGILCLLAIYLLIIARCFYITIHAQDTFSRLFAGSLTLMFFFSVFINIGMVTGLLPVVGVPLPLVSYGGSAGLTVLASFGMLMSIQTHRRLIAS